MRLVTLCAVACAALAVASCGGTEGASTGSDCLLLENGNKLCGDDARAYCEGFGDRPGNAAKFEIACEGVGVPITSDDETAAANRADSAKRKSKERDKRLALFVDELLLVVPVRKLRLDESVPSAPDVTVVLSRDPTKNEMKGPICEVVVAFAPEDLPVLIEGPTFDAEDPCL